MIEIRNHGPLIVSSTYWETEHAAAGKLYCSCNAGAIRILVPASQRPLINEWRTAEYAILSRGPWPAMELAEAVEILWEDHTDSPFALQLSSESFDLLPAEPPAGQQWIVSAWDLKKSKPHKALERPCYWRRVPRLPCLKAWEE